MVSSALWLIGLSYSTDYFITLFAKCLQCRQSEIGCSHKQYSHTATPDQSNSSISSRVSILSATEL